MLCPRRTFGPFRLSPKVLTRCDAWRIALDFIHSSWTPYGVRRLVAFLLGAILLVIVVTVGCKKRSSS